MTYSMPLLESASDRCPGNLIFTLLQSLKLVVWVKIGVGVKLDMHSDLVGEKIHFNHPQNPNSPPLWTAHGLWALLSFLHMAIVLMRTG